MKMYVNLLSKNAEIPNEDNFRSDLKDILNNIKKPDERLKEIIAERRTLWDQANKLYAEENKINQNKKSN